MTSVWKKFSLNNNVNAVVLGQIYRSMLSSFLRIGEQYLPPCFACRKILSLNSSEWWQHWPIHPPQNYRIPSILSSCLGIEGQYGPPPSLRSGGQPVLRLNSSAWWQYWPIHPPQNYSIPPVFTRFCMTCQNCFVLVCWTILWAHHAKTGNNR